jgi:hypothetical protein
MVAQAGTAPVPIRQLACIRTAALWAIGVYRMLLAGVAVVLLGQLTRSTGVRYVECTGDICHEAKIDWVALHAHGLGQSARTGEALRHCGDFFLDFLDQILLRMKR